MHLLVLLVCYNDGHITASSLLVSLYANYAYLTTDDLVSFGGRGEDILRVSCNLLFEYGSIWEPTSSPSLLSLYVSMLEFTESVFSLIPILLCGP